MPQVKRFKHQRYRTIFGPKKHRRTRRVTTYTKFIKPTLPPVPGPAPHHSAMVYPARPGFFQKGVEYGKKLAAMRSNGNGKPKSGRVRLTIPLPKGFSITKFTRLDTKSNTYHAKYILYRSGKKIGVYETVQDAKERAQKGAWKRELKKEVGGHMKAYARHKVMSKVRKTFKIP